ncbi:MlaD family protein [Sphingomicrobium nitratireducens]|uniref:MlaD family protein n=1 Tax=Sphingomicrobium nitratireducens TaxID=2964666 RepID=UPI002240B2EB|nr:MlaD family protein [Sphingomicrobium nitratireducens]
METRSNYVMVGAVTLALMIGLLVFVVWLAGLSSSAKACYDVYFRQGVAGLNRGSNVSFAGVPVGEVESINLLPERPEFVWVRISVNASTPVLQGTQATINGVGFTGVSEVVLDGAVEGAKPVTELGPQGCPVIPAGTGGLSAVLDSAPELIDRIQRLTERLTELLSDENQNAVADILDNVERSTAVLADRAPDLADAISDARVAARQAGIAAEKVGNLAQSTQGMIDQEARPAMADLRQAIGAVESAANNLDSAVGAARPGLENFSQSTLPEADRLVRDLRQLTDSLNDFTTRLDNDGIGGAMKPKKLPDYKPGRNR